MSIHSVRHLTRLWVTLACAVLTACGGGGEGGNETTPGPNYLPLATANRWAYDDGSQTEVTGQRTAGGQDWWVLKDTVNNSVSPDEGLIRSDAQGIKSRSESAAFGVVEVTLLRQPVVLADRYPAGRYTYTAFDYNFDGTNDRVDAQFENTVVGFEAVTTPAGVFPDALHVRQTFSATVTYLPAGPRAPLSSGASDIWLVDGIGVVKTMDSDTFNGSTQTRTTLLVGYQVGGRTGGTLPPR